MWVSYIDLTCRTDGRFIFFTICQNLSHLRVDLLIIKWYYIIIEDNKKAGLFEMNSKVLVYDMETTGFTAGTDEILQLSIVDGNGKELFNHLIKPTHTDDWSKAAEINGITKDKVADCETIAYWLPKLKALFASADLLVDYNQLGFDNRFLQVLGIKTSAKPSVDCMLAFSEKNWHAKHLYERL